MTSQEEDRTECVLTTEVTMHDIAGPLGPIVSPGMLADAGMVRAVSVPVPASVTGP
jgi:hypothetical protein